MREIHLNETDIKQMLEYYKAKKQETQERTETLKSIIAKLQAHIDIPNAKENATAENYEQVDSSAIPQQNLENSDNNKHRQSQNIQSTPAKTERSTIINKSNTGQKEDYTTETPKEHKPEFTQGSNIKTGFKNTKKGRRPRIKKTGIHPNTSNN